MHESTAQTIKLCYGLNRQEEIPWHVQGVRQNKLKTATRCSIQVLQQSAGKRRCTKIHQRPAVCTSSPLTNYKEEAAQFANLCFKCNKSQWHTLQPTYLSIACAKKFGKLALPLPTDFDCVSSLLVFCLSRVNFL